MAVDEYADDFESDTDGVKLPNINQKESGYDTDELLNKNADPAPDKLDSARTQNTRAGSKAAGAPGKGDPATKKLARYRKANEQLRAELERCMESQFRVRELENHLKSSKMEVGRLTHENQALEKMLAKPVKQHTEVNMEHMDRISGLMSDLRLLQEKTRKYRTRALEAERKEQRLTVQLSDVRTLLVKTKTELKQAVQNGMASKAKQDMEAKAVASELRAQTAERELELSKKARDRAEKRLKAETATTNKELVWLKQKVHQCESENEDAQGQIRTLMHQLKTEARRGGHHGQRRSRSVDGLEATPRGAEEENEDELQAKMNALRKKQAEVAAEEVAAEEGEPASGQQGCDPEEGVVQEEVTSPGEQETTYSDDEFEDPEKPDSQTGDTEPQQGTGAKPLPSKPGFAQPKKSKW